MIIWIEVIALNKKSDVKKIIKNYFGEDFALANESYDMLEWETKYKNRAFYIIISFTSCNSLKLSFLAISHGTIERCASQFATTDEYPCDITGICYYHSRDEYSTLLMKIVRCIEKYRFDIFNDIIKAEKPFPITNSQYEVVREQCAMRYNEYCKKNAVQISDEGFVSVIKKKSEFLFDKDLSTSPYSDLFIDLIQLFAGYLLENFNGEWKYNNLSDSYYIFISKKGMALLPVETISACIEQKNIHLIDSVVLLAK